MQVRAETKFTGIHADVTERIIGIFFSVANELGFGFVESVYWKSLAIALREAGFKAVEEMPIQVFFHVRDVGTFYADVVVNDMVVLELKAANELAYSFELQLTHYLRASRMEVGLVLAFGEKARFSRVAMSNDRKRLLQSTELES